MRRTPTLSRQTLYVMEQPAHRVRGAAVRCLSVLVLLTLAACSGAADVEVVAASSPPVAGSDRPSAAPSATATTATEERFTAHDAELLFRETLAEVEAVLGDLDLTVQAPALGALADPADVELNALEVAFDALVRRQEAEQERLERRFGRINADADKADRRCGDDPDCLLANLRDYEETTDRYFARADRVTARHDEESDWLIARMEQGSGVVTAGPADAAVDGNSDGGSRAADVSYTGDLQVGDCFDSASHAFRDVHVVPCDQPHQYEAIGVVPVPVDLDEAQRRCVREFERRLGQPVGEPDLSLLFGLVEGSETDDGRRLVVCFVGAPDDGLLQGAVVPGAS